MYNTFDHNLRFLWSIFKDFRNQIDPVEISLKQVLKLFCDSWLLEEFYQVISIDHHYQRSPSRSDYANGSYSRSLLTTMGAISLSVPRARNSSITFSLFKKYQRRSLSVDQAVAYALIFGLSTRNASKFFKKLFPDFSISASLASSIFARFNASLQSWLNRTLKSKPKILVLDAVHIKGSSIYRKSAAPVLFAYALYPNGYEEILSFQPARSESANAWGSFLSNLASRGLTCPDLIVSDMAPGIISAVATVFPSSKHQICIFHLIKEFSRLLSDYFKSIPYDKKKPANIKKILNPIVKDLQFVFQATTLQSCYARMKHFLAKYKKYHHTNAFKLLFSHLDASMYYFSLEKHWHPAARTTNRLERIFSEIKRRTKPIARFPNPLSMQRYIFAMIRAGTLPTFNPISKPNQPLVKEVNL